MINNGPTRRWNKVAFFTQLCYSKRLRFCPKCIEYDIRVFGEPYWHRKHQVPGVTVCSIHKISLCETCPTCNCSWEIENLNYICLDSECTCGESLTIAKEENVGLRDIRYAEDVAAILANQKFYEAECKRIEKFRKLSLKIIL